MQIYSWYSEAFKQYGHGRILICADSVEKARLIAKNNFDKAIREELLYCSNLDEELDEYMQERYDDFLAELEVDISFEPESISNAVFIMGSD